MRSTVTFAVGIISMLALLAAQPAAAGEPAHEVRVLTQPFSSVKLIGSIDLVITQAETPSLTIEARPDQLPRVRSEVRDGVLTIDYDSPIEIHFGTHSHRGPRALLSAKSLNRIVVKGSGDVSMGTWKTGEDIELALSGSGDATIDSLTARHLKIAISGSDDVRIDGGSVDGAEISIAGSGDFEGADLKSSNARVSVAGSGDVVVWATASLSVNIAGSGDVRYYGHPTLAQSVAGSGELKSLGDK